MWLSVEALLSDCVTGIEFAEPQVSGPLAVLPIIGAPHAAVEQTLTLEEGLASGLVTVQELSAGGSVPELEVSNGSGRALLILDGEQVVGGLQDRASAVTVLLGPGSSSRIPVNCVEHGRWHGEVRHFASSGDLILPRQRARKHEELRERAASGSRIGAGQSAIWESIAEAQSAAGVSSHTGALRDLYEGLEPRMRVAESAFPLLQGQRGLAAVHGGSVLCFELLGSPEAYSRWHGRLVRSLLADAWTRPAEQTAGSAGAVAGEFLSHALHCSETVVPAVGLGEEHYLTNGSVAGFALTSGSAVVHLSLFASGGSGKGAERLARPTPFPRSYWVEPGLILAGCYPGDLEKGKAQAKLEALLAAGIRSVISLMEPDEVGHGGAAFKRYDSLLWKLAREQGLELSLHCLPIRDQSIASTAQMTRILDTIDAETDAGRPVYVHCWGGRGRTGTVVGCWLARHGHGTGEAALARLQWLRRLDPTADHASPENETQRNVVRHWPEGQ